MKKTLVPIRDFGGLNRLDGADRVLDNQLFLSQNFYPATKGLLYKRAGSTSDLTAAQIPGCSKITGLHRHYSQYSEPATLYHCEPDSTNRPVPTVDLTLTEVTGAGADLFGGNAISTIRVCYTWVGQGGESIYNTASRAGYVSTSNTNAWAQTGHQSITVTTTSSAIKITVPAFPPGVVSANLYAALGSNSQMTYIGTVTQSGGSYTFKQFIGPAAANNDAIGTVTLTPTSGNLKAGRYYVSLAWMADSGMPENPSAPNPASNKVQPSAAASLISYAFNGSATVYTPDTSQIAVGMSVTGSGVAAGTTVISIVANDHVVLSAPFAGGGFTTTIDTNVGQTQFTVSVGVEQKIKAGMLVILSGTFSPFTTVQSIEDDGGAFFININTVTLNAVHTTGQINVPVSLSFSNSSPLFFDLPNDGSGINVQITGATSANGAKDLYVFVGTTPVSDHPHAWVANLRSTDTGCVISSLPDGSNAQTFNLQNRFGATTSIDLPGFYPGIWVAALGSTIRRGFLVKKGLSGAISEILPSRTMRSMTLDLTYDPTTSVPFGSAIAPSWLWGFIRTNSDNNAGTPVTYNKTIYPVDFAYFNGLSYFVNGVDTPWQTDGKTLGGMVPTAGTLLPPHARFITIWQDQILVAGSDAKNQVYACNSNSPRNWSVAGGGQGSTGLLFVTIGDLFGDAPTAISVYSRTTDAINTPGSYFLGFKKHGIWMLNSFPTSAGSNGSYMQQLSGRIGCVAPKSIISTPLGVLFLGNDGDVYMIRGGTEPYRIGTKVKSLFAHLVGNDTLMSQVTAVYHDDHYKICYPSSSTSTGNDAQLWADLRTMDNSPITWSGPHTGINVGAQTVYVGESDNGWRVGLLSTGTGSVRLDDTSTYQDLGTPITSVLQTKTFRFKSETTFKRYLGAFLDAYYDTSLTHSVLVEFFADEFYAQSNQPLSSGGGTYDSSQFDQALWSDAFYQGVPFLIGDMNLVGRTLYVKVSHSNPNPFILAALVLPIKPERRSIV